MKAYDFNEFLDRHNTGSVKWDHIEVDDNIKDNVLALSIADMDLHSPKPILEALNNRVAKQGFGYSKPDAAYYDSVVSWYKRRFGYEIDKSHIVNSPGIVPALAMLIRIFSEEGDGVIIQNPVYYPFSGLVKSNNRELLVNSLVNNDGYYTMDFEDLEAKAKDPKTKLFLFCSPHNPVGRVWTKEELQKVIDICVENDVYLVSDEIHCDLVRPDVTHTPIGTLTDDEHVISCLAASKTFNLAGLQMSSILMSTEEQRNRWTAEILGKNGLFGSSIFGFEGTKAAYNHGEDWLNQLNVYLDESFDYIDAFLKENLPKAKYVKPEGTYFAWIDLREYGYSAEKLEDMMVNDANLLLDEGYIFGQEGAGFERLNIACPRSVLEECLVRMAKVINQ
jgi:cystathionine beta-lyase